MLLKIWSIKLTFRMAMRLTSNEKHCPHFHNNSLVESSSFRWSTINVCVRNISVLWFGLFFAHNRRPPRLYNSINWYGLSFKEIWFVVFSRHSFPLTVNPRSKSQTQKMREDSNKWLSWLTILKYSLLLQKLSSK